MDIALKQRLVGASVLIALAVVVLPMLLGGRPDGGGSETRRIEVTEQPSDLDFETRRYPVGQTAPTTGAEPDADQPLSLPAPAMVEIPPRNTEDALETVEGRELADASAGPSEEPAPGLEQSTAAEPGIPSPGQSSPATDQPVPAAEEPLPRLRTDVPVAASSGGRYMVQVASFGSAANAKRLSGQLGQLGYTVANDTVSSDVGSLNRVRVGPYASESEAQRVVAALKGQVEGIKPRVIDLQPGQPERVTQPSDPLVRWVVQVGSFSSSANADSLVARLRLEGMSAYREAVTSSGSTIYRVRVGPFVEREQALVADETINQRLSLDGVVMSAD